MNGETRVAEIDLPAECSRVADPTRWYAVRTRSRHEKLVARQLESQGIESFLPIVIQTRNWSDRRKHAETPLFSGYTFLRMIHSSEDRMRVRRTQAVVRLTGVTGAG